MLSKAAVRTRRWRAKRKALGLATHPPARFVANKFKTHCNRGHEFTEKNTKHCHGQRHCRQCISLAAKKARAAKPKKLMRKDGRPVRALCPHGFRSECAPCVREARLEVQRKYDKSPAGVAKRRIRARRNYRERMLRLEQNSPRRSVLSLEEKRAIALERAIANAVVANLVMPQRKAV